MARSFDGTGANYIRCSIGSGAAAGSGAYTLISLFKVPLFASATGLFSVRRSGTFARYQLVTGSKLFGQGDFSSGFGTIDDDVWIWSVERKTAGSAHYEMAYAPYPVTDPDTEITFGEAPDAANHGDPGAGDEIWLGETDLHGRGDQALHVLFTRRLSDAEIKAALTDALADIVALGPAGCWPLNQADPADDVIDVTANGADEIETVGTVGVSADPPGYDFSLGSDITFAGTVPAVTGSFAVDANNDVALSGSIPPVVGAFTVEALSDVVLGGTIPAITAAFTVGALSDIAFAGTIPAVVGHFTDGSDISQGVGPREIARTPLGRNIQRTPVGRAVV